MALMSTGRIVARIIIILGLAILGASIGICFQSLRITGKPQEFRSLAKLVHGGQVMYNDKPNWREQLQDFYGTIIETVESAELKRRALERVRALNPELREVDVEIRVAQTKGSGIFNVFATGTEPKYTRIFLDALLDEFIAFRQSMHERDQGARLRPLVDEVTALQKKLEESMLQMEKAKAKVESLEAKAEQQRKVARLVKLRDLRDDLHLELKSQDANDPARRAPETKLASINQEIEAIEASLQSYEAAATELRAATVRQSLDKITHERMLSKLENLRGDWNINSDYVVIQERATPAVAHVEDWKMPVLIGAIGGGLLGGMVGLLLAWLFVRQPRAA